MVDDSRGRGVRKTLRDPNEQLSPLLDRPRRPHIQAQRLVARLHHNANRALFLVVPVDVNDVLVVDAAH